MNAIRTRTLISAADIVVVRFGEKYKQWNAAFEAGMAAALTLTGATGEADLAASEIRPTYVIGQLADLLPSL